MTLDGDKSILLKQPQASKRTLLGTGHLSRGWGEGGRGGGACEAQPIKRGGRNPYVGLVDPSLVFNKIRLIK